MTEIKRDLRVDLAICAAASAGPWLFEPGSDPEWDGGFEGGIIAHGGDYVCDFGDSTQYYPSEGSPPSTEDATFITEARTGWPHAIERAINAEKELAQLRAGIAAAMTYPPGIIRAKLSRILAEVGADE